jgi:hypothetical protein
MAKSNRRGLPAARIQDGIDSIEQVEHFLTEIAIAYPPRFETDEPYGAADKAADALKNLREVLAKSMLVLVAFVVGCDQTPATRVPVDKGNTEETPADSNSEFNSEPVTPTEPQLPANQFKAKLISNHDGDSCRVLNADNEQIVIRLHGIDCPERGQPYGNNAKKSLAKFVGKRVVVVDKGDAGLRCSCGGRGKQHHSTKLRLPGLLHA